MSSFPPPTQFSEQLVVQNLNLARQVAHSFHRKTNQPYDDLEAIAFVGLIRGCRRYDPLRINPENGKRYALSTIVVPFIQGEILHWFRDKGHHIKYPAKWRELWGKIQRLIADPSLTAQDVAEQSGLSIQDINEMLSAMTTTANIDDISVSIDSQEPSIDRLLPLQRLIHAAWLHLHPGDQESLLKWWHTPAKIIYPSGPIQQFHRRLKQLLQGQTLKRAMQSELTLTIQSTTPSPKPKPTFSRRSRLKMLEHAAQLGIIVPMAN